MSDFGGNPKDRDLQQQFDASKFEVLLLEGTRGKGVKITPKWWDEFRNRLRKRHQKSKRK